MARWERMRKGRGRRGMVSGCSRGRRGMVSGGSSGGSHLWRHVLDLRPRNLPTANLSREPNIPAEASTDVRFARPGRLGPSLEVALLIFALSFRLRRCHYPCSGGQSDRTSGDQHWYRRVGGVGHGGWVLIIWKGRCAGARCAKCCGAGCAPFFLNMGF